MCLIKCEDINISYENKNIISNLSFEVNEGDYLCIVGENGSGKSSLVKAILSLSKNYNGKIVFGENLKQNEIGYLPQQNDLQNDFPASVWEVVLSGNLNSKGFSPFYSKTDKKVAIKNMDKLNILDLKKVSFNKLSGGQKQRVLLARALC
ncbi:MAG: metal ABC transporter ATP-binding protein, partial [Peptostreptococcaceae bacterium]